MTNPMIQIFDAVTGESTVREITDAELLEIKSKAVSAYQPTKEELLAELAALTAKIQALE